MTAVYLYGDVFERQLFLLLLQPPSDSSGLDSHECLYPQPLEFPHAAVWITPFWITRDFTDHECDLAM